MPLFRRKSEKQPSNSQNSLSRLPRSASNDSGFSATSWNGRPSLQRPQTLLLSDPGLLQNADIPPEALESPIRTTSRLSKTLQEVLKDNDALSCFISFMKSQRADSLIQFWCDAQSFQASTLMRMHTHALTNVSKSAMLKRRSGSLMKDETSSEKQTNSSSLEVRETLANDESERKPNQSIIYFQDSSWHEISQIGSSEVDSPNQSDTLLPPKSALLNDNSIPSNKFSQQPCDINPIPMNQNLHMHTSSLLSSCPSQNASSHQNSFRDDIGTVSKTEISNHDNDKLQQCDSVPQESDLSSKPVLPTPLIVDSNEVKENNSDNGLNSGDKTKDVDDVTAKLRKSVERDAVTIFSNYIAKDAPKPIGVSDQLRADTISRICLEDGNVDPECFQQCQDFVMKKIASNYFQSFKDSEYHCRHLINILTSGNVYLPDVLLAENALCYFMEYMEQEGAGDLMQLWLALENFQQQLALTTVNHDWEQAQNDAMVIYDKYFSLQATHPMGFDDKLRFEIEGNICREGGPLPNCFTQAKIIVLRTLDTVHFSHYLKSQVFHRYLSDLVSTVQVAEDLQHKTFPKGHRRNASDASSEHSIGSQSTGADPSKPRNTLLAVDTRKVKKGGHIEGDFSMSMDMFNPDDLWKRTSPGGMSLGSVDELGQFVSGFDSDAVTDKKKSSGFLKRWKDKEREQEEMALQIAQMIIKDVNTMTRPKEDVGDCSDDKDQVENARDS